MSDGAGRSGRSPRWYLAVGAASAIAALVALVALSADRARAPVDDGAGGASTPAGGSGAGRPTASATPASVSASGSVAVSPEPSVPGSIVGSDASTGAMTSDDVAGASTVDVPPSLADAEPFAVVVATVDAVHRLALPAGEVTTFPLSTPDRVREAGGRVDASETTIAVELVDGSVTLIDVASGSVVDRPASSLGLSGPDRVGGLVGALDGPGDRFLVRSAPRPDPGPGDDDVPDATEAPTPAWAPIVVDPAGVRPLGSVRPEIPDDALPVPGTPTWWADRDGGTELIEPSSTTRVAGRVVAVGRGHLGVADCDGACELTVVAVGDDGSAAVGRTLALGERSTEVVSANVAVRGLATGSISDDGGVLVIGEVALDLSGSASPDRGRRASGDGPPAGSESASTESVGRESVDGESAGTEWVGRESVGGESDGSSEPDGSSESADSVAGSATVAGSTTVTGTAAVAGSATVTGSASVTSAIDETATDGVAIELAPGAELAWRPGTSELVVAPLGRDGRRWLDPLTGDQATFATELGRVRALTIAA